MLYNGIEVIVMKALFKAFWAEILLVSAFIICTYIYPVRYVSYFSGAFLVLGICYKISEDERIKRPYSTILQIMIIGAALLYYRYKWF